MVFKVFVNGLAGRVWDGIVADRPCRIGEIKDEIHKNLGIPTREQRLFSSKGIELSDFHYLQWQNQGDETLSLLRRPPEQAKWLEEMRLGAKWTEVPKNLQKDPDVVDVALQHSVPFDGTSFIPSSIKSDPNIMERLIRQNNKCFRLASKTLRNDCKFVLSLLASGALQVECEESWSKYLSRALLDDGDFIVAALEYWPSAFRHASLRLRSDSEVALAAVGRTHLAYLHLTTVLRQNSKFAFYAAQKNPKVLIWNQLPVDDKAYRTCEFGRALLTEAWELP